MTGADDPELRRKVIRSLLAQRTRGPMAPRAAVPISKAVKENRVRAS